MKLRSPLRIAAFTIALVFALVAIVVRLTQVQIVEGEVFAAAARANQVQLIPIAAPRGLIVDRHGAVMVRSRPSFVCALIPSEVKDIDRTIHDLAGILSIKETLLYQRLYHHRGVNYKDFSEVQVYEPYGPVILASELSPAQMARLAEAQTDLPGVDFEAQPVRNYPHKTDGAHLFGFVGAITEDEYTQRKREGYSPNDVIGKDGLESTYDQYLRGKVGGQQIEVNAAGALVKKLQFLQPLPGNTLVTTIDWRLQGIAERNLKAMLTKWGGYRHKRLSGAVVIINPEDGGVLALASFPEFDPNDFATPISPKKYTQYVLDPLRPLYDRAIGASSPSGSTFKMVTGSGAISSGVIKPNQVLYDSGSWYCHGFTFRDIAAGGSGRIDFVRALAASSDGYFYQLGDRLGHERLRYYALQYGLNAKSGIDLPGEFEGNWPTNEWMMKVYKLPLEPSDVCQLAIGQGAMLATPLQIANVAATVVNGGTLFRPHIVEAIRSPRGKILKTFDHEIIRKVNVSREALREVREGMSKVTDPGGTAYGLKIEGLPFGGKTGSAETGVGGSGANTTWFVAYAPVDHPKMAMAVFMEKSGGYGASVAAPVAQHIMAEYYGKKLPPI
ncbi:MAG: penicillin-binding protein 2 [Candidatus Velthaea sp.]